MEQFGLEQINDPHLLKLHFFPNSMDIFKDVAIADGISIVFKDMKKTDMGFLYVYSKAGNSYELQTENPGEDLMPLNPLDVKIVTKFKQVVSTRFAFLHDSILSQKLFSIESDFVENNPALVREYQDGEILLANEIKLFTNDKAGKSGRAKWYVANKDVITTGVEHLGRWKIVVSSANAGGQKRSNQIAGIIAVLSDGRELHLKHLLRSKKHGTSSAIVIVASIVIYLLSFMPQKFLPSLSVFTTRSGFWDMFLIKSL